MQARRIAFSTVLLALAPHTLPVAGAQGFAAVVSPPRFEIAAKPGERIRQVVEISNAAPAAARYQLRTADWQIDTAAGLSFSDELAADSCRPWVAIERREIEVPGNGSYRYRFEVQPPADAPSGECRFALMIEGDEQTVRTESGMQVPISGRIAVIVYVAVGDAAPSLQVAEAMVADVNGRSLPVLEVSNSGNAHGRVAGFLTATDANGRRVDLSPSTLPILPGDTRRIALSPDDGPEGPVELAYPLAVKGTLELGAGQRVAFERQFER
jgi:hypothetical protein